MDSFLTPYGLANSGEEKLQFTPFGGGPKRTCSDGLRAGTIESHNFFVLGPILVKIHFRTLLFFSLTSYPGEIAYFNSRNRELSNGARVMELY